MHMAAVSSVAAGCKRSISRPLAAHVAQTCILLSWQGPVKCIAAAAPFIASGGADDTVHIYHAQARRAACHKLFCYASMCFQTASTSLSWHADQRGPWLPDEPWRGRGHGRGILHACGRGRPLAPAQRRCGWQRRGVGGRRRLGLPEAAEGPQVRAILLPIHATSTLWTGPWMPCL